MDYSQQIITCLKSLGRTPLDVDYRSNIDDWLGWYSGRVKDFHTYQMFNGVSFVDQERASLKAPKRVSEDWASLLFNEKVEIVVKESLQEKLNNILKANSFSSKIRILLERTFALGTGALVEYLDNKMQPRIDYIIAPMIFPLRQRNGDIIDCAFASIVNNAYIYINLHEQNLNGSYTISNIVFKLPTKAGQKLERVVDLGLKERVISSTKRFQILKPNIANNLDLFTCMGLSIFANAIEQSKTLDLAYDSFKNEFRTGRKKQFIRTDVLTYKVIAGINSKGEEEEQKVPIFDQDQTEFYALPGEQTDDLLKEVNPELRITEHIDGIQTALNIFSDTCGLGPDRFNFKDGSIYTNTSQVISTKSKLFSNLKNHESLLEEAIRDMVIALLSLDGINYTDDVSVNFDDSIIEDTAETKRQAMLEFNAGLIDDIQYYQDVYNMTEEQAIEYRNKLKERAIEEPLEYEPPEGA